MIYVASSWRNPYHPLVIEHLEAAGLEHYDFRNPPNGTGFGWQEVMPSFDIDRQECHLVDFIDGLGHPRAVQGFESDFDAMKAADTFVLVLPCGKSAHLELGWAVGAGRRTAILFDGPVVQPELMYRMVDLLTEDLDELLGWLGVEGTRGPR